MKKFLLAVVMLLATLSCTPSRAECYPSSNALNASVNAMSPDCVTVPAYLNSAGQTIAYSTGDVCQNTNIAKLSASIVISTATTTELVATSGTKTVYVCSLNFTTGGTTPTYQFKTGTKTSTPCDTSAANISGAFAPTSGSTFLAMGSGILMQSSAGGEICVLTGGTTPAANGFITYVQQ